MNIDELVDEVHYTLGLHSIQMTYENAIANLTNTLDEVVADPDIETINVTRVLALQRAITILQNEIEITVLDLDMLKPIPALQNYFTVLATSE
jgi:hypothetical protein